MRWLPLKKFSPSVARRLDCAGDDRAGYVAVWRALCRFARCVSWPHPVDAARAGYLGTVSLRAVQAWEAGVNYPTAERLRTLVGALFEGGGLTEGHEREEAESLWAAVLREAPHMRTPFDTAWFDQLLSRAVTPTSAEPPSSATRERREDWGDAPDTVDFVGRRNELALQRGWILEEQCRLVAVLGIGGIGKTNLAARLAQEVAPGFERVYWRSLRDAPPLSEWLAGAISFLADDPVISPATESEQVSVLLQLLRSRGCLLVLDNYESLFEPGRSEGTYRMGLEGYARLLRTIGDAPHQSCLVLTSRESPRELALVVGGAARAVVLEGLGVDDAHRLLAPKQLLGSEQQWIALNERFGGNGLALKVVGESIRELFGGEIGAFLEMEATGASSVFGGTRRVLAEQIDRGSALEQHVLRLLAVEREPLSIGTLVAELGPAVGSGAVLEAVEALRRRSLVERTEAGASTGFTLQSVVLEFVTNRIVDTVIEEIEREQPVLIVQQPLIRALAKDYVRQTQERLIGSPIVQRLQTRYDLAGTEQHLRSLLDGWRGRPPAEQAYGPGNVVDLLRLLVGELRNVDLSQLAIRQAYLAEVDVQGASLVNAHLTETALADAFDFPGSVALSGDGALLAIGTSTGQVLLWRLADRVLQWSVQGPTGVVWGVALTADGRMLASSDAHGAVSLWDTSSGRLVAALDGNTGGVWGMDQTFDGVCH
jgi:hypothetical protein